MNLMRLNELLARRLPAAELSKVSEINVSSITLDSREVTVNSLFVALSGSQTDGRLFISDAFAKGASAVICELDTDHAGYVEATAAGLIIYLPDLVAQLSALAAVFYRQPNDKLKIIAVTGTNGKTTVSQLIAQWLELLGHKTYTMGTLGNGFSGRLAASPNTTLNAIAVQHHLALAAESSASFVVMEVSSHGLAQHRVADLFFDVAVFTNLSRDHLDFHGDMASYAAAKRVLFSSKYCRNAVINGEDLISRQWLRQWDNEVKVSCFNRRVAEVESFLVASDVSFNNGGISAIIEDQNQRVQLDSRLLGAFNLENILAALNALTSVGFELVELAELASSVMPVAGRMEAFINQGQPTVVVDYAHTSDALAKALQALRLHCDNELVVVFGCGGDRDQGKRPLMAATAEQYADKVIFTQDNSRSEEPANIFKQMFEGISNPDIVTLEFNRAEAVELAVNSAGEHDVVLLAGKGHEDYQVIGKQRLDYDERAWAKKVLARRIEQQHKKLQNNKHQQKGSQL